MVAPTDDPALAAGYKMLTAATYAGTGGTIELNTYLGSDGSPSDLLVVSGSATTANAALPIAGFGIAPSLEAGYPVPLPLGPRFVLEPQMQGIWQYITFDQENDGLGPVDLGSAVAVTGRIGLRGQWTLEDEDGVVWQPYGRVNLRKDWNGRAATMFSEDEVPLLDDDARLELAAGLTTRLAGSLSAYAQAGYQFALDSNRRQGTQGTVGLRWAW